MGTPNVKARAIMSEVLKGNVQRLVERRTLKRVETGSNLLG
uniref:Uncharacterized protein n=1 Tax=Staphylococcus phage HS15 TaxID=3056405 RepID=A0AA49X487_9VIRU|nr:MAG: hypothetical protein [Staphylococcus phage HS15]DAJ17308.1 MAG TPA: hypothetical protein [Siphoviridae sp. ctG741]DAL34224.1 MAG TPA_asm: hypothetical protein [Caudoviricetes sp.]